MARPTLSPEEVESFRRRLCEAALRKFAVEGFASVTIRGLADELGCSHGRAYRYFESKQDIFDAVRALAYERFAAALDLAAVQESDSLERVRLMMGAYVQFSIDEPHAYRIMFELDQPTDARVSTENLSKRLRAWDIWLAGVGNAVEAGSLSGKPTLVAHVLWAGVHGVAALHLAGKLVIGESIVTLAAPVIDAMLRSHAKQQ